MSYEKPIMEILKLEKQDVITTSVDTGEDGNGTPVGGSWA